MLITMQEIKAWYDQEVMRRHKEVWRICWFWGSLGNSLKNQGLTENSWNFSGHRWPFAGMVVGDFPPRCCKHQFFGTRLDVTWCNQWVMRQHYSSWRVFGVLSVDSLWDAVLSDCFKCFSCSGASHPECFGLVRSVDGHVVRMQYAFAFVWSCLM